MLADVIDADELATGQRKEGAYTAAFTFTFQVGSGITVALVGFALALSGFRPNVEQTPAAVWTMRGLFAGAPLVACPRAPSCCAATRSTHGARADPGGAGSLCARAQARE